MKKVQKKQLPGDWTPILRKSVPTNQYLTIALVDALADWRALIGNIDMPTILDFYVDGEQFCVRLRRIGEQTAKGKEKAKEE